MPAGSRWAHNSIQPTSGGDHQDHEFDLKLGYQALAPQIIAELVGAGANLWVAQSDRKRAALHIHRRDFDTICRIFLFHNFLSNRRD